MRLTLRTLLAYMDDILEPGDAEELGDKISENKGARNLVHHIRSCSRRMRLRAPRLEGKGMGLDPNTVAEYLDNTLNQDRIPDFERVCLESDVHLAEVASCHQILTLVLGEPAEVERHTRKRIYRLVEKDGDGQEAASEKEKDKGKKRAKARRANQEPVRVNAPEAKPAKPRSLTDAEPAAESDSEQRPDYMPAGEKSRLLALALTLLVAVALIVGVLTAMGKGPLAQFFGDKSKQVSKNETQPEPQPGQGGGAAKQPVPPSTAPQNPPPKVDATKKNNLPPKREVAKTPARTAGAGKAIAQPTKKKSTPARSPQPKKAASKVGSDTKAVAKKAAPAPVVPNAVLGRFISDQHYLARLDEKQKVWLGVSANAAVRSGDRLLSLPAYRPQVLLAPGIKITFVGATSAALKSLPNSNINQLELHYGRAIVLSVGTPNAQMGLNLGGRQGVVRFVDAQSYLVVEVNRWLPPGATRAEEAQVAVQVYASGQVEWREASGLPAPRRVAVPDIGPAIIGQLFRSANAGPAEVQGVRALPKWVNPSNGFRGLDDSAAEELLPALRTGHPLNLKLLEQVEHRLLEVRSLAIRGLAQLDIFDPMVAALEDPNFKTQWGKQLDFLRAAMARGGQSTNEVKVAFEKFDPANAPQLLQMVVGHNAAQLQNGGAQQLVEALRHQRMAVRVLGYLNLNRITDKTFLFQPWKPPAQSQQIRQVGLWESELKQGRIVYKSPPSPFPPLPKPKEAKPSPGGKKGPTPF